jgi:hypothetical protein
MTRLAAALSDRDFVQKLIGIFVRDRCFEICAAIRGAE